MNKSTLVLAHKIESKLAERYQEHLDEIEFWHAQGKRARTCEHGTNQWTDWDNICGGCEEGSTMGDGVQRRRLAIERAKYIEESVGQAMSAWGLLIRLGLGHAIDSDELGRSPAGTRVSDEAGLTLRGGAALPCPNLTHGAKRSNVTVG